MARVQSLQQVSPSLPLGYDACMSPQTTQSPARGWFRSSVCLVTGLAACVIGIVWAGGTNQMGEATGGIGLAVCGGSLIIAAAILRTAESR